MTRVCAKFIPKLLSDQQKNLRLEIAQDNLEMINSDENFLKKIITGDETWVYGYDPETKQQSSQWKFPSEPRPKKARQSRSNIKSMLIGFFYYEGIVHHEYAHTGQTINKEYYIEVLKRLRNAIRRKRLQLWESGDWLLHHRQCSSAHIEPCATVFIKTQYCTAPPASIQSRYSSLRLLAISSIENAA
ncbi:histone-lysine n-methyltransferase setmar-like protein [Trichonephila clavipes]|nr:histone-lysine n-methyltransferase setmar-like protein [Trichonephila clavipes]